MTEYGMPTLIENASLQDNIDLCSSLGLRFIELNMNFPEYQIDRLEDTDGFISPAKKAGVYYTIHLDETLNVADFNPLVREAYLETVRRTILVAEKLLPLMDGASHSFITINMHMNHGIFITLPDRKVQMYERDFDVYFRYFTEFRDKAEAWIGDRPIRITIENTEGFKSYEKRVIDMLLESKCFCLTWDIGHSKAVGETDVPYIQSHLDKLVHMHIHDGSENPPKNHLELGTGSIDLPERLATAEKTESRCVLETKTIKALKGSVAWLKREGMI